LKTVVAAGRYRLVVRAIPVQAGTRDVLMFRSSITDRDTGVPVERAHVRVSVRAPSGAVHGPYTAAGAAGSYYLLIPIVAPDRWRALRFTIAVDGPLGAVSARYVPPNLFRQWLFAPGVFALTALTAALFLQGFIRLRRRGRRDHASWGRLLLFTFGLCALVLPLVSPLDVVGDRFLLSAHMLQHVLIGDVAPALLLLAVRGPLLFFLLPRPLMRLVGRAAPLRHAVDWLVRPKTALTVWGVAYGGWHIPAAYDLAARHQAVHDLEHASFVVAGLLVWAILIDPARRRTLSRGRRLGVAALLFWMGTVISDVLIFSFHPLYPAYAHQAERVFALSPVRDQQFAGLVMTIDQLVTLGTCTAILLWPVLAEHRRVRSILAAQGQPA
jgi:cytochrome c oxidase assembly factor CtaG